MKVTLLGQGYEPESINSVGNNITNIFSTKKFHTFIGISAFVSESAIKWLSKLIEPMKGASSSINLIVGVDQGGTSKEALCEILKLEINSFVFYQSESPIFHPKIYLFEGARETKLIIGSSNLTSTGMYGNIECSVLIEFNNDDPEGIVFVQSLKTYYQGLFEFNDPNLFKITSELIEDLIAKGIVPTENVRLSNYKKRGLAQDENIGMVIPKRRIPRIPKFSKQLKAPEIVSILEELEIDSQDDRRIVWQKKNIPRSDAQQVSNNTSVTAVLRLSDAGFKIEDSKINRNTYFRDEVFGGLNWERVSRVNNSDLEQTYCEFDIFIDNVEIGTYNLKISHDEDRISDQNNIPTTIHWGHDLIAYFKAHDITGKTLSIYGPSEKFNRYKISIDS